MENNPQKIRPTIAALKIGDTATFPVEKMKSVRAQTSELGIILNRHFITRTDREKRVIIVKRIE